MGLSSLDCRSLRKYRIEINLPEILKPHFCFGRVGIVCKAVKHTLCLRISRLCKLRIVIGNIINKIEI